MPNASTMTKHDGTHRCCGNTHKEVCNMCLSLLVPLMIALFTITTTMLQMNTTKQINEQNLKIATDNRDIANYTRHQQFDIEERRLQREHALQNERWKNDKSIAEENRKQDLQIAKENREKTERIEQLRQERDIQIANETRLYQILIEEARLQQERHIEDGRRAADLRATENRQMDTILAMYLNEMSEFLLTENFTLANRRLATVLRAKTLTVLRQLDEKRKSHLVQFLYEAELLIANGHSLDLSDADLNRIDLNGRKLENISLSGALLRDANFTETSLDHSDFSHAQLIGATFYACQASNSNFSNAQMTNSNLQKGAFVNGIFDKCDASESNFTRAVLTSATFVQARLANTTCRQVQGHSILFSRAILDDADFSDAYLVEATFESASLRSTNFKKTKLSATNWQNATVLGADFRESQLRGSNISKQQLRQTFSFEKAIFSNGINASKTNLLINGDAEKSRSECSIAGWKSTGSMTVRPYLSSKVPTVLGACYFTGLENESRAIMSQQVNIKNATESKEKNRRIWIYGRCRQLNRDKEFYPQFRLREFSDNNYNLKNYTWTLSARDEHFNNEKAFDCNPSATQLELEITFRRQLSAPVNETFGYCDNLRLAVYDNTYS